MDDEAVRIADEIEKALTQRISAVYGEALKKAIRMNRRFLQKIRDIDSGKIQPPNYYNTPELIKKWREGYIRELMRQEHVLESIEQQIRDAGGKVEPEIKKALAEIYAVNANYTATKLTAFGGVEAAGKSLITGVTRRQAAIIFRDTQPMFSKIAFRNLVEAPAVIRRLQNEMVQATLLGESQEKIIRRIRAVMDNSAANARRIAQTERTRLQSQARADQLHEAAQMGVRITKTWSTRMVNSRDSHKLLNNKTINEDEKFHTIWNHDLAYPGDPSAPAEEVINCFVKETRIASNTSVEAATEREYIGELVTIETRGGIKFTCTPNHPVLTDKGWIAAGALYEGCNILTSGFTENFCSWIYPNKNNVVPRIYDIYQLFSRISFVNRIGRGLVNFHGDIPDTDVKVVFSPCFLQNRRKPIFFKKIKHFFFEFSDFEKATFSCKCMIYKFTSRSWQSATRFIRFLRNFCLFFRSCMLKTKKLRFAKAADRTAVFKKKTINSSSIQSFSVCDGIDRFPVDVTVDDIISVKRRKNVACHVYNLQTENQIYGVNESISQNGEKHNCKFAIVHNCHCVLIPNVVTDRR